MKNNLIFILVCLNLSNIVRTSVVLYFFPIRRKILSQLDSTPMDMLEHMLISKRDKSIFLRDSIENIPRQLNLPYKEVGF